jgi:hypothetical protein
LIRLAISPSFGAPDGQVLYDECNRYRAFVDELTPLLVSDVPAEDSAQLLSLENQWFSSKFATTTARYGSRTPM